MMQVATIFICSSMGVAITTKKNANTLEIRKKYEFKKAPSISVHIVAIFFSFDMIHEG